MTDIIFYHNPRCSKSRQALALLKAHGVEPTVVEYLKSPPDADTLSDLLDRLGLSPRELMRRGESVYKELDLERESLDRAALIQAMVEHPILIERPIAISGDRAVVGRPPENVLELL